MTTHSDTIYYPLSAVAEQCPRCRIWTADAASCTHGLPFPGCPGCRDATGESYHSDACSRWRFVVAASPDELDTECERLHAAARREWNPSGPAEFAFRRPSRYYVDRLNASDPRIHDPGDEDRS